MFNFLRQRHEKYYAESKIHLFIDLAFVMIIIILILANIILFSLEFPIESIEIKVTHPQVSGEATKPVEIRNTNLILNSDIIYYTLEGEQLGIGPWPPVVGETTSVRVFLDLTTDIHAIKNLQFKAKLPANIIWTGKSAVNLGQAIFYDQASGLVVWTLDKLNMNEKAEASFEIKFTPASNDLGKQIKLLENLSVSAVDSVTGQGISAVGSNSYSSVVEE